MAVANHQWRVLVTGGLGFIGTHLVERLLRRRIDTVVVDNGWNNGQPLKVHEQEELARRKQLVTQGGARLEAVDLRNFEATRDLIDRVQPTHVAHLAGLSRVDLAQANPNAAFSANVATTQALLSALAPHSTFRRFVFASSSMVYGHFESPVATESQPCRPIEPYGATKLAAEVLVSSWGRQRGVETVIVRPSAVYGPGDFNRRVPELFVEAALAGRSLLLHEGGRQRLDFTFVDDTADGVERALFAEQAAGECFNITAGDGRSLAELATIISAYVPGTRTETTSADSGRPRRGTLDISRARQLLGYAPQVSLEEGIRRVLAALGHPVPAEAIVRIAPPADLSPEAAFPPRS